MILLDFYSGSHGHFLEYIINTYIFKGPKVKNIFIESGASHGTRDNKNYNSNRVVYARHYTEFNVVPERAPVQIVRITVDSQMENIVYQINIMFRAGDIPIEKKIKDIPEAVRNNTSQLRLDYYSKLMDNGYPRPSNWLWDDLPAYEFPMSSLFNLYDFYAELKKLAYFLEHTFNPDDSLAVIWQEFMQRNQGWQYYNTSQDLISRAFANKNYNFTADIWMQALLNYQLSESIGMCDGVLFNKNDYPSNTNQLYQIVQQYIREFDNRF